MGTKAYSDDPTEYIFSSPKGRDSDPRSNLEKEDAATHWDFGVCIRWSNWDLKIELNDEAIKKHVLDAHGLVESPVGHDELDLYTNKSTAIALKEDSLFPYRTQQNRRHDHTEDPADAISATKQQC